VRKLAISAATYLGIALCAAGCTQVPIPESNPRAVDVIRIDAGPDAAKQAQAALINAKPGQIIEFAPGRFDFGSTLSLDVSRITLRGQGADKTMLAFKNQGAGTGAEGLLITSKQDVTLQDLAVEDARGDGVKVQGTQRLVLRNVRVEWTGGPKETNGGYGLYPVLCSDVLIENCRVEGASDAGIYVGQSQNIVVRRNTVQKNVAGIEIENSTRADVYDNLATDNSGGILIFTMPDLPTKEGRHCRVFQNRVLANNHDNFAPKGNIVATVPPGTGVMIMANRQVEVFDNKIAQNQTSGLSVVSYLLTEKPITDDKYDPFCEAIDVHDNDFSANGAKPSGPLGEMLAKALGTPLPDILYDGIKDPKKQSSGKPAEEEVLRIRHNGNAGFANFDAVALKASAAGKGKAPNIVRDIAAYAGEQPPLAPVSFEGLK
jgi:parallel beta-helix repeat protein